MSCWWQDIDTGEIFERPDEATCYREAVECLQRGHRPYVSHTRIPAGHGAKYRAGESQLPLPVYRPVWDAEDPPEPAAAEEIWSA